jgi:hypothetical protein
MDCSAFGAGILYFDCSHKKAQKAQKLRKMLGPSCAFCGENYFEVAKFMK